MGYKIYIANKDKTTVLQMQIVPDQLPAIGKTSDNETFKTWWKGQYSFIEKPNLKTLTLSSWWTERNLYFKKSQTKPAEYINLINSCMDNAEPMQLIIINDNGSTYINGFFSVENFEYYADKMGDIQYTIEFKEYREVSPEITSTYTIGWNEDSNGWWYSTDGFDYYTSCWQQIDGDWYYFKDDGYAMSWEWLEYKGEWYFFDLNCKMVAGKWLQINGKWYYFYADGIMARNTTIGSHKVDSSGAWVQ